MLGPRSVKQAIKVSSNIKAGSEAKQYFTERISVVLSQEWSFFRARGHHGSRRQIQGAKAVDGGMTDARRWIGNTNWRGHDDVMQIRSFRGIGRTRLGGRIVKCVFSIGTRSAQSIRASGRTRRINRPDT